MVPKAPAIATPSLCGWRSLRRSRRWSASGGWRAGQQLWGSRRSSAKGGMVCGFSSESGNQPLCLTPPRIDPSRNASPERWWWRPRRGQAAAFSAPLSSEPAWWACPRNTCFPIISKAATGYWASLSRPHESGCGALKGDCIWFAVGGAIGRSGQPACPSTSRPWWHGALVLMASSH